jgi:hypothetical protein
MLSASLRFIAVAAVATTALGCDDDPTNPPQQTATVRIINAAVGTANVAVLHTGATTPVATLSFRGASECVEVPAGSQTLAFRAGTDTLTMTTFNFEADERYTVVVAPGLQGAGQVAAVFSDDVTVTAANSALRFINATATAGDVHVLVPGGTTQIASGNLGPFGSYTNPGIGHTFIHRATDQTDVRLYDVGESTSPRASLSLAGQLPASRVATVVFFDPGTPAGATSLVVGRCD